KESKKAVAAAVSAGAASVTASKAPRGRRAGSGKGGSLAETRDSMSAAVDSQVAPAGDIICREVGCESLATSGGYCRLHYIRNWKRIKRRELILKEGKLNRYIEELVA